MDKKETNDKSLTVKEIKKNKVPLHFKLKKTLKNIQLFEENYAKINVEDNFTKIIKQSIEGLKSCKEYEQIIEEEKNKYKGSNWLGDLPKVRLLNQYNFYVTMLGIIDCKIDYFGKLVTDSIPEKTDNYNYLLTQKVLLKKREELTTEIIEAIKPNDNIKKAILTYPTHSTFSSLFENMLKEEKYIDTTIANFSTAYNNGYCIGNYNRYEYFDYIYSRAKTELKIHQEKLDKKSQKIRNK